MTEKCNRYINKKQRSAKHSSSSAAALHRLSQWRPMKLPPQVVLMRLKCITLASPPTPDESSAAADDNDDDEKSSLAPDLLDKIEHLQSVLCCESSSSSSFLEKKRSHCFWCTCDSCGDTPFFIPVRVNPESKETTGYGHFCSPNCALAWLYSENNVSPHEKHERDQLIHLLFLPEGSSERFRPAPDPRLLLDKFTGNLTVDEYRSLFHSDLFLFPMEYNITRQWKEIPEMTDSKLCRFYGKNFQGFRTGFRQFQKER